MRLIDADALAKELMHEGLGYQYNRVINAPTVDAVQVIRCCDCIYFEYFENQFVQMTHCDVHDRCPDYTDYCSWAVRKEE